MKRFLWVLLVVACGGEAGTPIGASGGMVVSADGKVQLEIPAGALTSEVAIGITPMTAPSEAIPGTGYQLSPSGTFFAKPIRITLAYDPANLPAGSDEGKLGVILGSDGGLGMPMVNPVVDIAAHTVSAEIVHFSPVWVDNLRFSSTMNPDLTLDVSWVPNGNFLRLRRAFHGACPPGKVCPLATSHFGCRTEDFDEVALGEARPARVEGAPPDPRPLLGTRPPETTVRCQVGVLPNCGEPSPPLHYNVSQAGFYCFAVIADDGEVFPVAEAFSFGRGTLAPAPTGLVATANPIGTIGLRWDPVPPAPENYVLAGYYIYRSGGPPPVTIFDDLSPDRTELVDGDVTPGVEYTYHLYARTALGFSPPALTAKATALTPPAGLPEHPDRLDATAESGSLVRLTWDEVGLATSYYILRTGGGEPRVFTPPGAARELADPSVVPGTTYTYSLAGENAIGRGLERYATVTTPVGGCGGQLGLAVTPTALTLNGPSANVAVTITRGDGVGQSITLTPSLTAGSPLVERVTLTVPTGSPTTGNTATLTITRASTPFTTTTGLVELTASDGTPEGTCAKTVTVIIPAG